MPTLELSIDELKEVSDALHQKIAHFNLQAQTLGCTQAGLDWIKQYEEDVNKIIEKVNVAMRVDISLTYNQSKSRWDWGIGANGPPEWRTGLKDLEDTKKWLRNEKFLNPFIVFSVIE